MAMSADPEKCWYRIYKASYPYAAANAPPVTEVRGLRAAEKRCQFLGERLTPEERADGGSDPFGNGAHPFGRITPEMTSGRQSF